MSRVDWCRCQWPTNRAPAPAEGGDGLAEAVGPELALVVLVTAGAAELEVALVVEDAPVPDEFFEHPAPATVTSPAMAIANPDFATETPIAMRRTFHRLQPRATPQRPTGIRLKR